MASIGIGFGIDNPRFPSIGIGIGIDFLAIKSIGIGIGIDFRPVRGIGIGIGLAKLVLSVSALVTRSKIPNFSLVVQSQDCGSSETQIVHLSCNLLY